MDKINLKNIKIAVLGGGVSSEREISLISSRQAFDALKRKGLDPLFIDINTRDKDKIKQLLGNKIDVAFVALHGEFGEDGKIQQILEGLQITYTGSNPLASYQAMDKIVSKEIFIKKGIFTPGFKVVKKGGKIPVDIKFPAVVKPYLGGSSIGISIVSKASDFKKALEEAFCLDDKVLIEEFICGRELTVGILDETPLPVIEIMPKEGYFDFKAKYSDGLVNFIVPASLKPDIYNEVQKAGLCAHQVLGCRHFSRVDILLDKKNTPYVLEVNSIPGMTTHSLLPLAAKHAGIDFDELILKMITLALYEKQQ